MSMNEDYPIRVFDDDPNVYINVYNSGWKWYYYNPDQKPLGEGAMGKVFLGYDYETHQKVAIKQLFDRYANNASIRERAKLEASLSYRHPNIVEMLGCCMFEDEDGDWHVWVLSNYVDGENIDKQIAKIPDDYSPAERVSLIANEISSVLDAMDYLHSKGVVHRDIKPSNIMVSSNSGVKLMDLGVARVTSANAYTAMGFVGTPLYASPEQILRDKMHLQATPASDIYSLGMTLYVLINGEHPFDAPTETQILVNQVTKKLPPSSKIPKKYKQLMGVIWKATEKNQENRYQSAVEFRNAIQLAMEETDSKLKIWIPVAIGAIVLLFIIFILCNYVN